MTLNSDEPTYPHNSMKHAYCPRDEFEFVNWGWQLWGIADLAVYFDYLLNDDNWGTPAKAA